jgi:hypothetical protein
MTAQSSTPDEPKEGKPPRFYLCMNMLRPGDVLLTHGGDTEAKIIATLAGGEYSHAALLFGRLLYESDGENWIGYKLIHSPGWAMIDGEQVMLGMVPANPKRCCVLRHRDMALVEEARLEQALEALYFETQGRDYSEWNRLLPMIRLAPRLLKPIASRIAERKDLQRSETGSFLPGAFCSEVVVSFFDKLELDMGGSDKSLTAPGDLAQRTLKFDVVDSGLVEYPNVVKVRREELLLQTESGLRTLSEMLEDGVESTAQIARAGQLILDMKSKLNHLIQLQDEARTQSLKLNAQPRKDRSCT